MVVVAAAAAAVYEGEKNRKCCETLKKKLAVITGRGNCDAYKLKTSVCYSSVVT